jgi:hypothetical protein
MDECEGVLAYGEIVEDDLTKVKRGGAEAR